MGHRAFMIAAALLLSAPPLWSGGTSAHRSVTSGKQKAQRGAGLRGTKPATKKTSRVKRGTRLVSKLFRRKRTRYPGELSKEQARGVSSRMDTLLSSSGSSVRRYKGGAVIKSLVIHGKYGQLVVRSERYKKIPGTIYTITRYQPSRGELSPNNVFQVYFNPKVRLPGQSAKYAGDRNPAMHPIDKKALPSSPFEPATREGKELLQNLGSDPVFATLLSGTAAAGL